MEWIWLFYALLGLYGLWLLNSVRLARQNIPTITGWVPFLGVVFDFGRDSLAFLERTVKKTGSTFRAVLGGQTLTFLTNPHDFDVVWKQSKLLSFKEVTDDITMKVTPIDREKVVSANDDAVHRLWIQHLQGGALLQLNGIVASELQAQFAASAERAASSPNGELQVKLLDWASRLLFSVGSRTIVGPGWNPEASYDNFIAFDQQFPMVVAGLPKMLLSKFFAARDGLARQLEALHATPELLSPLINARIAHFKNRGYGETDIAQINTLLVWALHANTSPVAFWTLAYIFQQDPVARDKVVREVDALFESKPDFFRDNSTLSQSLDSLEVLSSAVKETMRLTTSSFGLRVATSDCTVNLTPTPTHPAPVLTLKKGDKVMLAPLFHRDPELFAQPNDFRGDRFVGAKDAQFVKDGKVVRTPVVPFGGGVSMCPGRFLAMNEVRLFVALVVRHWEIQWPSNTAIPPINQQRAGLGSLPPMHDVQVSLRPRRR